MTSKNEKSPEAVDLRARRNVGSSVAMTEDTITAHQVDFAVTEALLSTHAGRLALRSWRKTDWGRAAIEAHRVTSVLALLDDDKKQVTADFRWCEIEQQLLKSFVRTEVNQVMAMLSEYVRTGTYR
tara:strand:- start:239 stop:616 length:378 start_codon:yes stop_codon:yes gene_type:complete